MTTRATTSLTAFVTAMLDADEAAARAACRPRPEFGHPDKWEPGVGMPAEVMGPMESVAGTKSPTAAAHIARHDPARVLAQVAALRAVVELHEVMPVRPHYSGQGYVDGCCAECTAGGEYGGPTDEGQPNPCPTLRAIASIWADAPGFDAGLAL